MKSLSSLLLFAFIFSPSVSHAQDDRWKRRLSCFQLISDSTVDLYDATDSAGENRVVRFMPNAMEDSNILLGTQCKLAGTHLSCKDHHEKMKIVIDISELKYYASWIPEMSFNYYSAIVTTHRSFWPNKVERVRCR